MNKELRDRLSAIHRRRWGAPEGYATVRGVHVPFEHRTPIRYWSDWLAYNEGEDAARAFIRGLKDADWLPMPRLWNLYGQRKAVAALRDEIRQLEWESRRWKS